MTEYLTLSGKRVAVEPIEQAALYPDQHGQALDRSQYRLI